MNAITSLRSNGTQTGAREITKDIDEQPKKLSDGEAVRKREMSPAHKALARHKPSPADQRRVQYVRGLTGTRRRRPISAEVNTFAV